MRSPVTTIVPGGMGISSSSPGPGSAAWALSCAWSAFAQPTASRDDAKSESNFKKQAFPTAKSIHPLPAKPMQIARPARKAHSRIALSQIEPER
jgi:hypothetical protein